MVVKLTSKRQVTFPSRVLEALGVQAGDQLELVESSEGFLLRARRIVPERLAPLRSRIAEGRGTFDLQKFREEPHDPALRD
ncbi:MAG: AbrB/MazE/SpoVT family DNA-binding domain-containing protein [Acidobacteria bacterium]|nr:AbrB/MazE/SpoVT family DNA-binding domain-containing protein [Acidobacteriota bacterium]